MSGVQIWFTATWFWKVSQFTKKIIYTTFGLPLPWPFVKCFHLVSVISSINFQLDIDECKSSNNVCDENANCSNTVGFYNCTCKEGFTGDGRSCSGKIVTDMPTTQHNAILAGTTVLLLLSFVFLSSIAHTCLCTELPWSTSGFFQSHHVRKLKKNIREENIISRLHVS